MKISRYTVLVSEDSTYNFIYLHGSLSVCACTEELKSKPSVSSKSGRKNHIQYEMVPFCHKYGHVHVPGLVSGYFSFLIEFVSHCFEPSLTTLFRKASTRVRHVLGFEFFSFGL